MYLANAENSLGWVILSNEKTYPTIIAFKRLYGLLSPYNTKKPSVGWLFLYFTILYLNNCAAWFLVSTFSMSWIKVPCSSKTNVLRKVPTQVLPHIFFSPHAPKACIISVDGSDSNGKGNSYLTMKFWCDFWLSLLTP